MISAVLARYCTRTGWRNVGWPAGSADPASTTGTIGLGAIGGKILGAGGGGFLLLYAPPERHGQICDALPDLRPIPFGFSPQGSKLIYVEENGYA
jgi:hypothetical protein